MSDSTPHATPMVTANDTVGAFEILDGDVSPVIQVSEHPFIENSIERKQSYVEWRNALMDDGINSNLSEKSPKKSTRHKSKNKSKSNIELLTQLSPNKLYNTVKKPIAASIKPSKTLKNGNRKNVLAQSANISNILEIRQGYSEDSNAADHNKLTVQTGFEKGKMNSNEKPPLSHKSSISANYNWIQQVDQGKIAIASKKQKLKDLEEEIIIISDKMIAYQNETDEIIEDLQKRIYERDEPISIVKEDPVLMSANRLHFIPENQDYTSSDELSKILKKGASKQFKDFLNNCTGDVQAWKTMVQKEVETFNQYLQHKHKELSQGK
jgi:hypothetical protein